MEAGTFPRSNFQTESGEGIPPVGKPSAPSPCRLCSGPSQFRDVPIGGPE